MSIRSSDGKNFRRVARTTGDRVPAIGIRRNKAFYTATGGELSLDLQTLSPQISYQPGQGQLEVKSSAGSMIEGLDYYETSSTSISFPSPGLSSGERLEIIQTFEYSGNLVAQVRPDEFSQVATTGQTSVSTDFSWPLNQNPSKRHGAIMVYLNGILQQRGSSQDYVEVSLGQANTNQIQFNTALVGGENISIVRSYQAIDETAASTQFNNTRLSELQEYFTKGFQAMVDESATIAVPFTSIVNRSNIPDIANNLKVSFGVDRIPVQQAYQLTNEFGPSGQPVWAAVNDDRGLIRFVGTWASFTSAYGQPTQTSVVNDYVEITFYGTGLNLLTLTSSSRDYRVTVDGGSESANILPAGSSVLESRNYSPNTVVNVVSGLSLGIHTVKIRLASGPNLVVYGFEVLNTNSTTALKVNPGYGLCNGRKISSLAGSTSLLAKPAAVTGGRGGRVITYANQDGTIGQAVTLTNASQLNLTSADHTNEEIARVYHWREFGAGRADDFSLLEGVASNRAFTLEDGTATLVCSQCLSLANHLYLNTNGSFMTFTFVGTGLDISLQNNDATAVTTILVDGTSVGTTSATGERIIKLVSGLPYGTHTVKILRTTATTDSHRVGKFIVYQPKKPSLPAGCIELADYNMMADFVANSTAGLERISSGVLRKTSVRELVLVEGVGGGTNWASSAVSTQAVTGFELNSNKANAYIEYTFFGTGFDFRFATASNRSSNIFVSLQNLGSGGSLLSATTANFPTLTSSVYGTGVAFSSGTLDQLDASTNLGCGFVISNLPLSMWKVRLLNNSTSLIVIDCIDIITPIHSHVSGIEYSQQNTLPIGSQSVGNSRMLSVVKDDGAKKKNISQAFQVQTTPTQNSGTDIPCIDLSVTHFNTTGKIKISYSISVGMNGVGTQAVFSIFVNGTKVSLDKGWMAYTSGATSTISDQIVLNVPKEINKIDVYIRTSAGGTATLYGRNLLVEEID